jgi:predicted GNAT family acetyltransferase
LHQAISVIFPTDLPGGRLRAATGDEHDFLSHWQLAFQREAMPREAGDMDAARIITDRLLNDGDLFVWQKNDGWVVSMAARARPTVRGISVNLVYTPPEERRRGYAAACVAHLSQWLLDSGYDFCTLFTDRANATANKLYARIGYNPIADFDEYRFRAG